MKMKAWTCAFATLLLAAACDGAPGGAVDGALGGPPDGARNADGNPGSDVPDREPLLRRPSTQPMSGEQLLADPHASLLALSAEEAAWLDRHGYPTVEEMESIPFLDLSALEDATRNHRDKKAAALLGHRRAMEGDLSGALAAFSAGSNLGSLYARQQLALHAAQRQTGLPIESLGSSDQGNLGILIAELEVARLLGDHRAQVLIDKYAENFYWDLFGKQVQLQVRELMDQYGEYTRSRGERSFGPDPRPNADAWSRLRDEPDTAVIPVYTREKSP